jgi:ceramide glucosyltransferase
MSPIPSVISFLLVGLTITAMLYYLLSLWAAVRFFRQPDGSTNSALQPVTIMVPLCGADLGAYESYATLCRLDYPDYQILFPSSTD